MLKSFEPLVMGCPTVWEEHPAPEAAVEVTQADRLAIAEDCRRRAAARLHAHMVRAWPRLFWPTKRELGALVQKDGNGVVDRGP